MPVDLFMEDSLKMMAAYGDTPYPYPYPYPLLALFTHTVGDLLLSTVILEVYLPFCVCWMSTSLISNLLSLLLFYLPSPSPPSQVCKDTVISTPNSYSYNWIIDLSAPSTMFNLVFEVKASNDAHVAFSTGGGDAGVVMELPIGGWGNIVSKVLEWNKNILE